MHDIMGGFDEIQWSGELKPLAPDSSRRRSILDWNINLYFQLVAVIVAGVVAAIAAAFIAGAWLF